MRSAFLWTMLIALLGTGPVFALDAGPDSTGIDSEAAWQKVSVARDQAAQDRHSDAVQNYLEALGHDARLAGVVAKEIGFQKLWREDADQAIFYFQRYLALRPGQENRDVRGGLALAYSWSGRQPEAVAMYRQLAKSDPADGAARIGLGRSLIWNNELGEGFIVLRQVETEFSQEEAAGREASGFLLTYLDSYTTPLGFTAKASWDSDKLAIYRGTATGAFTVLGNKLALIQPGFALFHQPGQKDISAPRFQAGLVGNLGRNWALHAYGWVDFFRGGNVTTGSGEKFAWDRPGGDVWLTWLPAARWRMDFGGSSQVVETFQALKAQLHHEQASASLDWRFARNWNWGLAGIMADYSDGNRKQRGKTHLRWRREGRWEFQVGPDFTYMDFSDPYPGGYWAPNWVRNGSLTLNLKTRGRNWTFAAEGSLGREQEAGAEAITVGGGSLRMGRRFGGGSLLSLETGYSKSSLTADSGYERTFVAMNFKAAF